jgi:hypothetical protein
MDDKGVELGVENVLVLWVVVLSLDAMLPSAYNSNNPRLKA